MTQAKSNNHEQPAPSVEVVNQFYMDVLASLNMVASEDGLISYHYNDESRPVFVSDQRLVLPLRSRIQQGIDEAHIAFHPLSESEYRGESEVIGRLKKMINLRLTTVMTHLINRLVYILADKDCHKHLTPKQKEILTLMPKADERTIRDLVDDEKSGQSILDMVSVDNKNRLVSIYLKKGGKINDRTYNRLAVVRFPITEWFDHKERKIFDKQLRVKDYEGFIKLFGYVVPHYDEFECYAYGSASMVAPYFHALMGAYLKAAKALNTVTWLFRKHIEDHDDLMINTHFETHMSRLSEYKDIIPALKGNVGKVTNAQAAQGSPEADDEDNVPVPSGQPASYFSAPAGASEPVAPTPPPVPNGYPHPVQAPHPQVPSPYQAPTPQEAQGSTGSNGNGEGLSWTQIMQNNPMAQMYQPAPQPMGYPQQGYPQPMSPPGNTYANHPRAMQAMGYSQPMAYPQQGYPQPMYPQQGYPQPMYPQQQGYPQPPPQMVQGGQHPSQIPPWNNQGVMNGLV